MSGDPSNASPPSMIARDSRPEEPTPQLNSSIQVNNPNEMSISLNISRAENLPLVAPTAGPPVRAKFPSSREQFMRKPNREDDQDQVIRNLLKAKGDTVTAFAPEPTPDSKEDPSASPEKKSEQKERKKEEGAAPLDDDVGSVASRTKSLMKHIRALRNAVYEQYCPRSVQQLKYVARFVFLVLLVITLVYFIIAKGLYQDLRNNVSNVYSSKDRLVYTTAIGSFVRSLVLINPLASTDGKAIISLINRPSTDYYLDGFESAAITGVTSMNYQQWAVYCLEQAAKACKVAQNGLSTSDFTFSSKSLELINPAEIKIAYKAEEQIAGDFTLDCWSAIMGLVVHGLKVKDLSLSDITADDSSVYYILENAFNNILDRIYESTAAIEDESKTTADSNRTILMTLLIVASVAIAVSVGLIMRVAVMVSHNKEDILKLFIDIPSRNIKQQLNKCRRYFITFRDSDKVDAGDREMEIEDDEEEKKDEKEGEDDEPADEEAKRRDESAKLIEDDEGETRMNKTRKHKKKKYKPYSTQLLLLIMEFAFFIALLESYFLASYLESDSFLSKSTSLIVEIGTVSLRTFTNGFLYRVLQEYIGTNGTATIQGIASETYITTKLEELVNDQENFLRQHSDNTNIDSAEYNDFFNSLVYNDACSALYTNTDDITRCSTYSVLNKGLHSANIAYWDAIREVVDDFQKLNGTDRNLTAIRAVFAQSKLQSNERMENHYFTYAYQRLLDILDDNLKSRFDSEYNLILIIFIMYLVALFLLYFFVWTLFVESTRNSLWVTKCMLGIIPVNTILEVKNIKDFLINSSKGLMLNLGAD